MAVARYTLAVDRRSKKDGEQNADFINCIAFKGYGEFAEKYFRQGMRILVSGRIQTGSYTNKDGVKIYTTDVIVDDQEFADSKNASGSSSGNNGGYQPTSRTTPTNVAGDGFMNIPDGIEDEELPFN